MGQGIVALFGIALLTGCAGVTVTRIPDELSDQNADGFRFYENGTYLLVYTDNKGGVTSQVLNFADQTKKLSARPYACLASNDTTLTFTNGVLSGANTVADETALPNAMIGAAQVAASAAAGALLVGDSGRKLPGPRIYKLTEVEGTPKYPDRTAPRKLMLIGGTTKPADIEY